MWFGINCRQIIKYFGNQMSESSKSEQPPIILVDGSSYLYRAYHVPQLQSRTKAKGDMEEAGDGVINNLRKPRED